MNKIFKYLVAVISICITNLAMAATEISVPMHSTTNQTSIGTVQITETPYGLLFTPNLHGLTPGTHGFHIHDNPSCDNNGMAAGGHLDPAKTGKHLGPYGKGHLGDLPALYVNADGTATLPVLAPRLKHLSEVKNHSLMIHEGGDNYSDTPAKLGGGGGRMFCGIIK